MTAKPNDVALFLSAAGVPMQRMAFERRQVIMSQGDACDAVFYLEEGRVRQSVTSRSGREAILATLESGDFFGEECLTGQKAHKRTATAVTDCRVFLVAKAQMVRMLHTEREMSARFISHLLARNIRIEEDLVDQMLHSSEQRLARALLMLARYEVGDSAPVESGRTVLPITQETLAEMIGTTRSRVNAFMKKFERLGHIDCTDGLMVKSSLAQIVSAE